MAPAEPIADLRLATPDDAEALGGVGRRAWGATYRGHRPRRGPRRVDRASAPDSWRSGLRDARRPTARGGAWVAERDGVDRRLRHHLAGEGRVAAAARRRRRADEPVPRSRRHRHRRRARCSTSTPSTTFASRGFNPLVVWAFRDNQRARAFYASAWAWPSTSPTTTGCSATSRARSSASVSTGRRRRRRR